MKKVILSLALALSLFCTTAVATDYTDVPTTHTFYTEITQAVSAGYFNGTSETTYNPGGTISNQQFMVVIGRVLGLTDSSEFNVEDTIFKLIQAGIITGNETFASNTTYGQPMTRESMAYIMAHVLEYTGETLNADIDSDRIPDYEYIGDAYRDEVITVYSNGILMGTDSIGTFNPKGNLTRGAAAAVIMRLVEESNRSDVLSDTEYYAEQAAIAATTVQTIYEGQTPSSPAKAGDIYVKADGTTVVLAYGENGILGEGQGVSADLGLITNSGRELTAGTTYTTTDSSEVDSFGNSLNNQTYKVNPITGSGHWGMEISVLNDATYPTTDGTFECELSSDQNWLWTGTSWYSCFNLGENTNVDAILAANS